MTDSPRPLRRYGLLIGVPLLIVLASIVGGIVFPGKYTTEQTATREFQIDMDFTKLRKLLVRTNAAKEIITMGGDSEFVSQKWNEAAIETSGENVGEALLRTVFSGKPDWSIDLEGELKVRTKDEYVGQEVVTLKQEVQVRPDKIESLATLLEGSERLKGYELLTRFSQDEDKSKVELSLTQAIKTDCPWWAHSIADRRVHASAAKALENQQRATIQLVEENADKNWLFPLQ